MVFPEPCRPHMRMTVGGADPQFILGASPPSIASSSSLTILIMVWSALRELKSSSPTAFSLTLATKAFATEKFTSASSKATRTSRNISLTSDSLSRPFPRNPAKTLDRRRVKLSNI